MMSFLFGSALDGHSVIVSLERVYNQLNTESTEPHGREVIGHIL